MNTATVSLQDVLAYNHPQVIRRYCLEQHAAPKEAKEVFREMLRWLYLCYRGANEGFACAMTPELAKIDEMWHTFVLFTPDYADFCERYFGFFLHHVPTDDAADEPDDDAVRNQLEKQFALIYDVLGPTTLKKWHDRCKFAAV